MSPKLLPPLFLATALLAHPAWAEDAGMIKNTRGSVTVIRGATQLPATVGMPIQARDQLRTGADGCVGITLRDATLLSAGPNATLSLDQYSFNPTTHEGRLDAGIRGGSMAVISGKLAKASPESVRFRTPTVTLGVRGTSFIIDAGGEE